MSVVVFLALHGLMLSLSSLSSLSLLSLCFFFPHLRHAKRRGSPRQRAHVVLLRHVVHDEVAGGAALRQRRRGGRQERRSRGSIGDAGDAGFAFVAIALFLLFLLLLLFAVDGVRHDSGGGSLSCVSQDHGQGLRGAELSGGARRADRGEVVGQRGGSVG